MTVCTMMNPSTHGLSTGHYQFGRTQSLVTEARTHNRQVRVPLLGESHETVILASSNVGSNPEHNRNNTSGDMTSRSEGKRIKLPRISHGENVDKQVSLQEVNKRFDGRKGENFRDVDSGANAFTVTVTKVTKPRNLDSKPRPTQFADKQMMGLMKAGLKPGHDRLISSNYHAPKKQLPLVLSPLPTHKNTNKRHDGSMRTMPSYVGSSDWVDTDKVPIGRQIKQEKGRYRPGATDAKAYLTLDMGMEYRDPRSSKVFLNYKALIDKSRNNDETGSSSYTSPLREQFRKVPSYLQQRLGVDTKTSNYKSPVSPRDVVPPNRQTSHTTSHASTHDLLTPVRTSITINPSDDKGRRQLELLGTSVKSDLQDSTYAQERLPGEELPGGIDAVQSVFLWNKPEESSTT